MEQPGNLCWGGEKSQEALEQTLVSYVNRDPRILDISMTLVCMIVTYQQGVRCLISQRAGNRKCFFLADRNPSYRFLRTEKRIYKQSF